MPEKFTENKSDDEPEEDSSKAKERGSWRPYEVARAEPKKWWSEPAETRVVPESEEVRRYAADHQAKLVTEWSLDDEEEDEASKEKKEAPAPKEPTEESRPETNAPHDKEEPISQTTELEAEEEEPETTHELPEKSAEAIKQIAREELETYETSESTEPDPAAVYLEKVAEEGNPSEAEQEIVMDYHLDEVRAQADQAIEGLEDLLKEAAEKVGDKKLSEEELTALAKEVVPEGEGPAEEVPTPEAFAPGPPAMPNLPTTPNNNVTTKGYRFAPSPVHTHLGSGSLPPTSPPSGGGGGGGGFGVPGFGGDSLSMLASMAGAGSPNQLVMHGLSAAERAKLRRQTLTVALFAGLLGYYLGKKKGRRQQEAKMRPELERKEKANKQLRYEVEAGEQRIRSLKRLKEEQEKEQYEKERREKFQTPEKQQTERPSERPPQPSKERLPAVPFPEQTEVAPTATISRESEQRQPIEGQAVAPSLSETAPRAPELSPERFSIAEEPEPQTPAERVAPLSRQETEAPPQQEFEVPSTSKEGQEIIRETTPLPRRTESFRPEAVTSLEESQSEVQSPVFSRPEIVSTRPGLEVPFSAGAPENRPTSLENAPPLSPEVFNAQTVSTMNMPELLTVAKEMTVGGENLGQLFQEKQIDADGLKRVVTEYARGGHPEQILAQERQITEVRRQSPEFLRQQQTNSSSESTGTQGGIAGLFAQTGQTDHLLPAYDHEQYPSDTPQHLLPAYDQETVTKRHHRTVAAASAMIGLGAGIILGLILL